MNFKLWLIESSNSIVLKYEKDMFGNDSNNLLLEYLLNPNLQQFEAYLKKYNNILRGIIISDDLYWFSAYNYTHFHVRNILKLDDSSLIYLNAAIINNITYIIYYNNDNYAIKSSTLMQKYLQKYQLMRYEDFYEKFAKNFAIRY